MRNRSRALAKRRGFTLIELMIVVSLLGIIGTMLTSVLVRQQRFHRAVTTVTDARARMRDISTILPTDMRSISTSGADILAITDTSMQVRAFIGASIVCNYPSAQVVELPPQILAPTAPTNSGTTRRSVLTSWINPPAPDDIMYAYDRGTLDGNSDDTWGAFTISDTASSTSSTWCPTTTVPAFTTAGDNSARRYRITLATAPNQGRVVRGAPIRFAREVRYSAYEASDRQWYVGFQRCTPNATYGQPGTCGTREVLAGPIQPGTTDTLTSGFFFVFYNKAGTRLSSLSGTDTVGRVTVGVRTLSQSLMKATTRTGGDMTGGDSLRFSIGMRNRI